MFEVEHRDSAFSDLQLKFSNWLSLDTLLSYGEGSTRRKVHLKDDAL